jgi:acetyl esterase/lipase
VEYTHAAGTSLCLDLHRPDNSERVPVVVYFHGGGFARGSRADHLQDRLLAVAAQGIAVASVSYRLTDVATHPAQLEDGRTAVSWLRAHGGKFGLSIGRIGAWGVSAGGWIALMLSLTGSDPSSSVQAVAAWMPPTDLATLAEQRDAAGLALPPFLQGRAAPAMEATLLGLDEISDDLAAARAASPLTHAPNAGGPTLLVHGDRDGLINPDQSVALHTALLESGHESQLMLLSGANHEDPQFQSPSVLCATAGFFSALL